ncbi:ribonuclease H-like domain-containing protein [Clostridium sp. WILCCON 0269]|uniref:Ribonuclease H-like domain-containing protein n=1 Tax=Candidatus Clostridium eludens TaxID=3381663 RepID=A0ABW8SL59_9CLOT
MEIKEYDHLINVKSNVFLSCDMENIAYFDIETTGFDRECDNIVLISFGRFLSKNKLIIKQYFADTLEDESEILYNFGMDILKYDKWCSYNGIAFDEPFIKERMRRNNICFEFPPYHIDLYRLIRPYYKQLGMERCNLKTVEKYLGINREDKIDGGISVDLYKEFLKSKTNSIKYTIMLHNYEDVLNLPKIHEFTFKIRNNNLLVRENCITEKQKRYLKILLKKNNVNLNIQLEKISKKVASQIIDYLLKGEKDTEKFANIIDNSY